VSRKASPEFFHKIAEIHSLNLVWCQNRIVEKRKESRQLQNASGAKKGSSINELNSGSYRTCQRPCEERGKV
jgi:hypothetical protein